MEGANGRPSMRSDQVNKIKRRFWEPKWGRIKSNHQKSLVQVIKKSTGGRAGGLGRWQNRDRAGNPDIDKKDELGR